MKILLTNSDLEKAAIQYVSEMITKNIDESVCCVVYYDEELKEVIAEIVM